METILSVNNLIKKYGNNVVVNNVSFEIEKGKIYGLLGPNGAGKTTIMKLITNLIKKDDGYISYNDDIKIKYLMDVPNFYEYMKVKEYLIFIANLNNLDNKEAKVEDLLNLSNLKEHENKLIKHLSRGLRQKLGIASVLVGDVDILILDEPVSALDPIGRKEVLDIITSLKGKLSVIFSSHILVDIESVCDHIIMIDKGNIILNNSLEELFANKNILLVKCKNNEECKVIKELCNGKFSSKHKNTLEIEYEDLTTTQLDILKKAKKNNIEIEKLEVKKDSLEEIFLSGVNDHE